MVHTYPWFKCYFPLFKTQIERKMKFFTKHKIIAQLVHNFVMSKQIWLAYNSKVHKFFVCSLGRERGVGPSKELRRLKITFSTTAILIFDFGFSFTIRSSSTPNLSSSETPGSSDLASDSVR